MILLLSVLIIFSSFCFFISAVMVALLDAGTSLWRLFVGMCWRPLRGTVLTGFGSLWGTPLHTVLRSTFNHRVYASNPWIYFPESYPHGSAPHQPDPPSSLACCLPRVSVVSTSCSSLVVVSAATINTPSQTDISSRRQLGVEDGSCWLSCYRSARSVIFRGIPLTVSPPFTSTHKPSPPPSLSVLVLKHLLPLRESDSFRHATPPISSWATK
ncbi:hypothetical protein Bca4012_092195 [Brassica carinata]|uniref:Uncharacterized protein n=1 Tax=Brassica carinata TaxID=52824 RepID=A0A8X7PRF2_BRACI|nr:hypothetical protein Bca52824_074642 [Brassica carinata]